MKKLNGILDVVAVWVVYLLIAFATAVVFAAFFDVRPIP